MKKLLIAVMLTTLLFGCNSTPTERRIIVSEKHIILQKKIISGLHGKLYMYREGYGANWYNTNWESYKKVNIGDTLNMATITHIYK